EAEQAEADDGNDDYHASADDRHPLQHQGEPIVGSPAPLQDKIAQQQQEEHAYGQPLSPQKDSQQEQAKESTDWTRNISACTLEKLRGGMARAHDELASILRRPGRQVCPGGNHRLKNLGHGEGYPEQASEQRVPSEVRVAQSPDQQPAPRDQ